MFRPRQGLWVGDSADLGDQLLHVAPPQATHTSDLPYATPLLDDRYLREVITDLTQRVGWLEGRVAWLERPGWWVRGWRWVRMWWAWK